MKKPLLVLVSTAFVLLGAFPAPVAPAAARPASIPPLGYMVNSLADTNDGACDATNCTLREAITAANSSGLATIPINFSVSGTIILTAALPQITNTHPITITGPAGGITISGNDKYRILVMGRPTTVTLSRLTFSHGHAISQGGAIQNSGDLTVDRCTFEFNQADTGGAIAYAGGVAYTMTIVQSTFKNNTADRVGGAIEHMNGTTYVTNSTFVANTAQFGAAISNSATYSVFIKSSTFALNSVTGGAGASIQTAYGVTSLYNTIVASTLFGVNCAANPTNPTGLYNAGNNISSDASCGWGSENGSRSLMDPKLMALADNGGLTETMALHPDSPAIDGSTYHNDDPQYACPAVDQRGVSRPVDGNRDGATYCDVGAFEYQPPLLKVFLPLVKR